MATPADIASALNDAADAIWKRARWTTVTPAEKVELSEQFAKLVALQEQVLAAHLEASQETLTTLNGAIKDVTKDAKTRLDRIATHARILDGVAGVIGVIGAIVGAVA